MIAGPSMTRVERQLLAVVDRRRRASRRRTQTGALADDGVLQRARRAGRIDQASTDRDAPALADHRGVEVDETGADLRQPHLEAGEIGLLEQRLQLVARDVGATAAARG